MLEAQYKSVQLQALQIYKIGNATQAAIFAEQLEKRLAGQGEFIFSDKKSSPKPILRKCLPIGTKYLVSLCEMA